jgi:murein L,D-transpeptidase YcbB/YkuD
MFLKKYLIYILSLLLISSCASTKIDPTTYTQENVKGQIDITDILNQDQYNYKNQHLMRLDKAISYYQQILASYPEGFKKVNASGLVFGKRYSQVKDLRFRLNQEGIYLESLRSSLYDLDIFMAIKRFQAINGLNQTGLVDKKTESALNIDLPHKLHYLQQSRKNIASLPDDSAQKYIVINIPSYTLYAFKRGHYIKNIDVIVGTPENKTPILNSRLTNIYFNPTWVVPPALLYTTIREQLAADSMAMKKDGFEVYEYNKATKSYVLRDITTIDWKKYNKLYFPFLIKMKPGKNNPMGKIKFEIINTQSITLHGTADHDLFISNVRSSSVGCIRLKDEFVLAEFALEGRKNWNLAKIQNLYKASEDGNLKELYNQQVTVEDKIPVYTIYQNTWVDDLGFVNFRDDIYNYMSKA